MTEIQITKTPFWTFEHSNFRFAVVNRRGADEFVSDFDIRISNLMTSKIDTGKKGEDIAVKYLKKHGYKILDRNFRSRRWGEIDIVASRGDALVFVEVKTREGTKSGEAVEAVTPFKIRSLERAGQYYKMEHPETPEALRIDVVSIILDPKTHEHREIKLFEDAR